MANESSNQKHCLLAECIRSFAKLESDIDDMRRDIGHNTKWRLGNGRDGAEVRIDRLEQTVRLSHENQVLFRRVLLGAAATVAVNLLMGGTAFFLLVYVKVFGGFQ